jgi:hypothetical protein
MEGLWKMVTQCLLIMLGFITQKHIALTCTRHKYTWDGPKAWNKFQKLNFKKQKIKWFWKPGELNLFDGYAVKTVTSRLEHLAQQFFLDTSIR